LYKRCVLYIILDEIFIGVLSGEQGGHEVDLFHPIHHPEKFHPEIYVLPDSSVRERCLAERKHSVEGRPSVEMQIIEAYPDNLNCLFLEEEGSKHGVTRKGLSCLYSGTTRFSECQILQLHLFAVLDT
jgi:hypothetical protein